MRDHKGMSATPILLIVADLSNISLFSESDCTSCRSFLQLWKFYLRNSVSESTFFLVAFAFLLKKCQPWFSREITHGINS